LIYSIAAIDIGNRASEVCRAEDAGLVPLHGQTHGMNGRPHGL